MQRLLLPFLLLSVLVMPRPLHAQAAQQRGRLLVTVADPSGAIVADAAVTITGMDAATRGAIVPPAKTTDKGVAAFDGLALGRYSITAEFSGFELGLLRDVNVRRGDNKHIVVLPLKGRQEAVTVGPDSQASAADRASTFGTALTREQIEALSDDPSEMLKQLQEMAGGNATIRVDSFEGQQLPPKSQIKAIHITRDQFAAENHRFEGLFLDIITQPGVGALHGRFGAGFYDGSMDGRNPLIEKKGPAQNQNYSFNISRALIRNRADFSLSAFGTTQYSTPYAVASTASGRVADNLDVRTPFKSFQVSGTFNYAITKDQTIRLGIGHNRSSSDNLGVGGFQLADHAYSSFNRGTFVRFQEAGPLGRRFFTNTRFTLNISDSGSHSLLELPTVIVTDSFTTGGAQLSGGRHGRNFSLMSDLDYVRGINSWRMGVAIEGGHYRSDDASNYLGTYTFETLDAFLAGRPRSYTRRIGDPLIAYWMVQSAFYLQDDIRVRKGLTLSPGVRIEAQTHVADHTNLAPRMGVTWAPFKSGKTTLRGSWGIFYDWLPANTYEQTLRVDGFRQQELNIFNPSYPDPGTVGSITATNRYLLDPDFVMPQSQRLSAGVQQSVTKTFNVGGTYTYGRGSGLLIGQNLNPPINGLRPDPRFANIIKAVPLGRSRQQSLSLNAGLSMPAPPGGANSPSAPRFSWKRGLGVYGNVFFNRNENDTDGAFSPAFDPTLGSEWGPALGEIRRRVSLYISTGALKNFNGQIGINMTGGPPINIRTGHDDNGDLIFNDRPAGTGRNSARGTGYWTVNGYFSYSVGFGPRTTGSQPGVMIRINGGDVSATTMAPQAAQRYRLNFSVNLENLTNHANYVGYSGVMTSKLFLQPTQVQGVRRISFSMGVSF